MGSRGIWDEDSEEESEGGEPAAACPPSPRSGGGSEAGDSDSDGGDGEGFDVSRPMTEMRDEDKSPIITPLHPSISHDSGGAVRNVRLRRDYYGLR